MPVTTRNNSLEYQARQLRAELEDDLMLSYSRLLDFSESYDPDGPAKEELILLGSKMNDIMDEQGSMNMPDHIRKELLREALSILQRIENEAAVEEKGYDESVDRIKKYFISNKQDHVIFRGEKLCKIYERFELKDISLELRVGEITSVIGENGNGKSTLLKIVSGEIAPSAGRCSYIFKDCDPDDYTAIKQRIGYIPQQIRSWSNMQTVREKLHFTAAIKGIRGKRNEDMVNYIVIRLGLKKYLDARWSILSGGYRLRCEIARQLVWSPDLLILDEPLANLDIKAANVVLTDLRNLTNSLKAPLSILISTQNIYDVENISDRVVFLRNGHSVYNGLVDDIAKTTKKSCYVIGIDCAVGDLQNHLAVYRESVFDIKDYVQYKIIFSSPQLTPKMLLSKLSEIDIPIHFFRDISNSTRIFFEDEHLFTKDNAKIPR
jgi:ABC-2 type transport system ATP-binding protein